MEQHRLSSVPSASGLMVVDDSALSPPTNAATPPLSLSDEEHAIIMQAAGPVHPGERGLILEAMAEELAAHPVRGVQLIHRLAAQLQSNSSCKRGRTPRRIEARPIARGARPGQGEALRH